MQANDHREQVRDLLMPFVGEIISYETEHRALLRLQEFLIPASEVKFIGVNAEIKMRDGSVLTFGEYFRDPE